MADLRRLHPRLTETDLDSAPFVPELSPVVDRRTTGELMTRPWLDWARRLTLLVSVKTGGGGGGGESDPTHVVGPAGATPDAIAIYSGSTGKLIKDSLTSIGSVISQAVSQAIAAILPGGKLPVSNLPLHKTTHQAGGVDAVDVKLLAGFPANNAVFLNGVGAFTTPAAGVPTAHATTHQPGGSDPMAVDAVAATGSLRTLGTGANQAAPGNDTRFTVPANHAARHSAGGGDPVTVTNLAGYPGGTTSYLRADGTFAAPTTGVPGPHHATHEVGGSDELVNAVWTNKANVFTVAQKVTNATTGAGRIRLEETGASTFPGTELFARGTMKGGFFYREGTDTVCIWNSGGEQLSVSGATGNVSVANNLTVTGAGGNVACKDQANVFTQNQRIDSASPVVTMFDTSQTANNRLFRLVNNGQTLYIQAWADDFSVKSGECRMDRPGNWFVGGNISEKGRTLPMGHPTIDALGSYLSGFSGAYVYSYIGKTLLLSASGSGTTVGQPFIQMTVPVNLTSSINIPCMCHLGAGWVAGVMLFTASTNICSIYPGGGVPWPSGTAYLSVNIHVPFL